MYLHLGEDTIVARSDVVGIYDLDNCTSSHITRAFLKRAEHNGQVIVITEELPKSFVVVESGGRVMVYLSQLSAVTLQKRC